MKKTLSILLALCITLALLPMSAFAAATITMTTVDQLEAPSYGNKPDYTGVAVTRKDKKTSSNVELTNVEWQGTLDDNGCFTTGVKYKVIVTLKTKNDAIFGNAFLKGHRSDATLITSTGDGYWCTVESVTKNTLVYSFTFAELTTNGGTVLNELDEAYNKIKNAWDSYSPDRNVTKADVLTFAKSQIPSSVDIDVTMFDKTGQSDPTETCILTVKYELKAGGSVKRLGLAKHIVPVGDGDKEKLLADQSAIRTAIARAAFSNVMKAEDVAEVAKEACKNGTKVEIVSWSKKESDYAENGVIRAKAKITLGSESITFDLPDARIPMLARAMPENISICAEEWDVLRLTNNERIRNGLNPVFAVDYMQEITDIRASELTVSYCHFRLDDSPFYTVFKEAGYSYNKASENIGMSGTPESIVTGWMNSEDHRKAILTADWSYLGVGYEYNISQRCDYWVQVFTDGAAVKNWETASGSTDYTDKYALEQDYLILAMNDGRTAYMPLDLTAMTETANGYSLKLDKNIAASFTVEYKEEALVSVGKTKFTDVEPDSYYEDAVAWAVERGFTSGTSETTFSPQKTCTRGEVVTFLWRSQDKPEPTTTKNPFTDIKESDWYYKAVLWAVENGITSGTSANTFSPDATCSTAQILTFIYRSLDEPEYKDNSAYKKFKDQYYGKAVAWANTNKMIEALSTSFNPDENASRADVMYYLFAGADSPTVDTNGIRWDMPQ